jgi:phosphoglycolate phosphatase
MKYQAVIFDLDGTLLDTLEDLKNSVNAAMDAMGFPQRTLEEVRRFVGNGVAKLIERAVPSDTDEETVKQTLAAFKEHYFLHCEDHTRPYEGVLNLLDALLEQGIKIAVVSNKTDAAVKSLCKRYFGDRISLAVGDREGMAKKPSPDAIFAVLDEWHLSAEEAVYIGDSEVDIFTAQNAKMEMICVTWGFRDRDFLSQNGATAFADSAENLKNWIFEK